MTAPLTPLDCDLTDFQRMMIDIPRLRGSDFDATLDDGAWRAGLNLWLSSWHQVPAASLSDDDATLTKAAGLGRDLRSWRKVKAEALRGWVKCDDGLLYHPVVAEFALEAWLEKLAQALSSGAGNAKRWKVEFDPAAIEADIDRTAAMLAALNPKSKALVKLERRRARSSPEEPANVDPDGTSSPSRQQQKIVPSGSLGKGTGKGTIEEPPKPPEGAFDQIVDPEFEKAWAAYPDKTTTNRGLSRDAFVAELVRAGGAAPLARTVEAFAAHQTALGKTAKRAPAFHVWLAKGRYDAFLEQASVAALATWTGPPAVWGAVVEAVGEPFARSWLARCGWQDLPRALISPNQLVTDRISDRLGAWLRETNTALVERAA